MSKENQETKLVKSLEVLGALFISIAVLVFLARIILDGVYGGSHLKKTTDIFMLLGVFTACLAFWLQKQVAWAIFFGVFTIFQLLNLLGI
ncbi:MULTISPECIES: hypothetical protein [Bacillati]|uniref:hypothetical protein n=1 Tax=Staphylococcus pasteuri TaxID=45972 RepID=UPI00369BA4D3